MIFNDVLYNSIYISKDEKIYNYSEYFSSKEGSLIQLLRNTGYLLNSNHITAKDDLKLIKKLRDATKDTLDDVFDSEISSNLGSVIQILLSSHFSWSSSKGKIAFLKEEFYFKNILQENLALSNRAEELVDSKDTQKYISKKIMKGRKELERILAEDTDNEVTSHADFYKVTDTDEIRENDRLNFLKFLYDFYFSMEEYAVEEVQGDMLSRLFNDISNNSNHYSHEEFLIEVFPNDKDTILNIFQDIAFPPLDKSIVEAEELKKQNTQTLRKIRKLLRELDSIKIDDTDNYSNIDFNTTYNMTRFENELFEFLEKWKNKI